MAMALAQGENSLPSLTPFSQNTSWDQCVANHTHIYLIGMRQQQKVLPIVHMQH